MNSPCTTELAAIRQCRNGSRKAFEVVVNKYMKDAYYIALGFVGNQEDAMDLSQEAFFRAYRNLDSLKSDSKFFPWFYQILKNLCFSHLRKFRNKKTLSLDGAEKPIDIQDDKTALTRKWSPNETRPKTSSGRPSDSLTKSIAKSSYSGIFRITPMTRSQRHFFTQKER